MTAYKFKRIINYLRRSRQDIEKEKRTGEDTLADQKRLMDSVLLGMEIPYDQKFEIGSGDKIDTRPVFKSILRDIESGKYDAIAVKELSRLGRGSYTDMGRIYETLTQNRVHIITPYKVYDPLNNADARQIRFELFLSREEFETTKERMLGAKYNLAKQGKWMAGPAPFGYTLNFQTKTLEENKDEANVIRLIFDLFVNGLNGREMGFRAISTYLSQIGHKTPTGLKHWAPETIKKTITRRVYIGQVLFNLTKMENGKKVKRPENEWVIVDGAHPAIVNEVIFYEAQRKFRNNRNTTPKTKKNFETSELAGLVRCVKCGNSMLRQKTRSSYTKKNGEISEYFKETLWCNTVGCTFLKYRPVEEAIVEMLETLPILEDIDGIINSSIDNWMRQNNVDNETNIHLVEQRKKELQSRLKFIFEKFESGIYSDDEFLQRKRELTHEIETIDTILSQTTQESKFNIVDKEEIIKYALSLSEAYKNAKSSTEKNQLLKSIIDYVVLEVTEKIRGNKPSRFNLDIMLKIDPFLKL